MKKFLAVLLACTMMSMFWSCSDDSGNGNGGNNNSGNNNSGNNDKLPYESSASRACAFLVDEGGENIFEMAFNAEESTDSQIKAAVALCEEEINGLPFCKEEYISLFSCYFALEIEEKDFSSKELKDALTKCASDHADCDIEENYESSACDALMNCEMAAYETHHPCGKADLAREECFHQSDDVEDAIHDHIDSYYHQYENL